MLVVSHGVLHCLAIHITDHFIPPCCVAACSLDFILCATGKVKTADLLLWKHGVGCKYPQLIYYTGL